MECPPGVRQPPGRVGYGTLTLSRQCIHDEILERCGRNGCVRKDVGHGGKRTPIRSLSTDRNNSTKSIERQI